MNLKTKLKEKHKHKFEVFARNIILTITKFPCFYYQERSTNLRREEVKVHLRTGQEGSYRK